MTDATGRRLEEKTATGRRPSRPRGQASLPALAVSLLVLTAATAVALGLADGALADADREALQRRAALSLSDGLVAADSPLTVRANVLDESAVDNLTAQRLRRLFPVAERYAVSISLEGNRTVTTGDADGGASVRRIVLVAETRRRTFEPAFAGGNAVTLPRRTGRVNLTLTPGNDVTVRTVRANGRVVLHDDSGLEGKASVALSELETATLRFEASGDLSKGDVTVTTFPTRTTKTYLEVRVDD